MRIAALCQLFFFNSSKKSFFSLFHKGNAHARCNYHAKKFVLDFYKCSEFKENPLQSTKRIFTGQYMQNKPKWLIRAILPHFELSSVFGIKILKLKYLYLCGFILTNESICVSGKQSILKKYVIGK